MFEPKMVSPYVDSLVTASCEASNSLIDCRKEITPGMIQPFMQRFFRRHRQLIALPEFNGVCDEFVTGTKLSKRRREQKDQILVVMFGTFDQRSESVMTGVRKLPPPLFPLSRELRVRGRQDQHFPTLFVQLNFQFPGSFAYGRRSSGQSSQPII